MVCDWRIHPLRSNPESLPSTINLPCRFLSISGLLGDHDRLLREQPTPRRAIRPLEATNNKLCATAHSLLQLHTSPTLPMAPPQMSPAFFSPPSAVSPKLRLRSIPLRRRGRLSSPAPPSPAIHLSTAPNWPDLSRRAQNVLSNLRTQAPARFGSELRQAALAEPANPFLWHALAKHVAVAQRGPAAAEAVLSEAVHRVPVGRRGGLYEAWGALQLRAGDTDAALRVFQEGIKGDPYAPLFVSLGALQTRLGSVDEARETFRQGSVLFPNHPAMWRAWAFLEGKHGLANVARDIWRIAVEKDRENAKAWRMMLQFEEKCGASMSDVVSLLYEAIVACPNDCALRLQLARLEEKQKGPGIARAILKPVEAQNNEAVLRALAKFEMDEGNHEKARLYYRKAADVEAVQSFRTVDPKRHSHSPSKRKPKQNGRTVKSLHAWSLMEVRVGNTAAARKILEEAKGISQADSGIWRAIGELESRERNFAEARKAFQNAVAIDPQDPRLLLAWGKAEAMAGDVERAELLIGRVAKTEAKCSENIPLTVSKDKQTKDAVNSRKVTFDTSQRDRPSSFEEKRNASLTPHVLAEALRERAMLASRNGQFEDSVNLLTRASQVEPGFASGWRLLASQELRMRGIESARTVYNMGLERVQQAAKSKLLHWWGQDERATGNIDKARALFRKATCASPDYMSAWMSWGLMEKSEGSLAEACDIFEQATKRAERDLVRAPYVFQAWGRVEELERGRPDFAAEVFQRGVNLVPNSGPLWSAWGLLEERRGNVERARELFRKATTSDSKHGSAWHSWALLEARRCNYERAGELFRNGNENEPTNSSLLASWAMMEGKELSNISRSRELFERAVTADPYFGPAWHSWGCIEMSAGSLDKARQLFRKAAEVRPDDPSPWHTLGVLEAKRCNDNDAAIKHWKRALEVAPGHALSYQAWGLLEGSVNNNIEEARRLFESGIEYAKQKPSDIALLLQSWASLEEQSGNIEEARKLLRKSVKVDRRRAETWQTLALVEKSRGNREGARRLLSDGVEVVWPLSSGAALYVIWATLEAEEGEIERARELFAAGIRVNPSNSSTWNAYAAVENKYGSARRAAEIKLTSGALFVRQDNANEEFKL